MNGVLLNSVPALASVTPTITSSIESTLTSAQGDALALIGLAVPIVGAVVAAGALAKLGIKWIRKIGSAN